MLRPHGRRRGIDPHRAADQYAVRNGASVARESGEEFIVVDLGAPGRAHRDVDRVRYAIAAPAEPPITTSVGVFGAALDGSAAAGIEPATWLDRIIERADRAMFDAKRQRDDLPARRWAWMTAVSTAHRVLNTALQNC